MARVERWVPGLRTLREYQRSWLASDLMAGLVLTALLVPVGMGYAQAAGLPPITGLYATIVPLVAYAAFGPSRVMVLGPDSSLAAVIAAVILPLGGDDPETAVALAGALAVLTGLVILVAGVARLGFVTRLAPGRRGRHRPIAGGRARPQACPAVLAAIVITAAISLVDVAGVRTCGGSGAPSSSSRWPRSGVVLVGALPGIVVAVGLSLREFIRRAWRP